MTETMDIWVVCTHEPELATDKRYEPSAWIEMSRNAAIDALADVIREQTRSVLEEPTDEELVDGDELVATLMLQAAEDGQTTFFLSRDGWYGLRATVVRQCVQLPGRVEGAGA